MIFTTKKGKHYSNNLLYKLFNFFNFSKKQEYIVRFTDTCAYSLNEVDQTDVNKLFGFSNGFFHHKDSVRFGWNYLDDRIVLYAYIYQNGKKNSTYICRVELETENKLTIFVENDSYIFQVEKLKTGLKSKLKVYKNKKFVFGYNLWPYFGGNNVAPQDISIEMVKIA